MIFEFARFPEDAGIELTRSLGSKSVFLNALPSSFLGRPVEWTVTARTVETGPNE